MRRALYDRLSGPRRAELHLRVGEALEAGGGRSGRALADLIVDGRSDPDLAPLSVERFRGWAAADDAALRSVCVERYARKYMK